jgi:cell division protein FtsI/penicillin-binding protein 2
MTRKDPDRVERRRLNFLAAILILAALVIVGRLVYYQVFLHSDLVDEMRRQRERELTLIPKRGAILDATEHPLAISTIQWSISASPPLVTNPEKVAGELATLLNQPRDELYAKLTANQPWLPLADHVPGEVGEAIVALRASGLTCEERLLRVYPEGSLTAHAIGIVNEAGAGYYGVEGYYSQELKGVEGRRAIEQSPAGQELPLAPRAELSATPGATLVLTLDRNVQLIAEQELQKALKEYKAQSGTVVIMDPRTGALLAIVSYPGYDPNDYTAATADLMADPSLSKLWEPGSIFKIVTWASGLDSGTISPEERIFDTGEREVGGRIIQNWDREGRGDVSMTDALAYSLNTVAAYISTSMGKDTFYNYVRRFGFGMPTGVDLAGEIGGLVRLPGDENWFDSDLGTNSFGQGIGVTPLQMISAAAAVANDGLLMKPYIVAKIVSQDGTVTVQPAPVRQAVSQETARTMTEMLVQVVEREGKPAKVPGYRVAGKTGTAQIPTAYGYEQDDTIHSYIGFAPADDPRFIVLVKLDRPQASPWANNTAAPTFKAIAQRLFVYMQIPPDDVRAEGTQGQ